MNMHRPQPGPAAPKRTRLARRSLKSRGAVLVLALLGGFLIVGLIGYVFNTGRHAQLRQQTQSAADATAITGAGYVARSFNTVAMNNVEISRLIAVVQMLDSMPLAVEYTIDDLEAAIELVEDQQRSVCPVSERLINEVVDDVAAVVSRRFGDTFNGFEADLRRLIRQNTADITTGGGATDSVEALLDELYEQLRILEEIDRFFAGYDVREMTFYDSNFGRGELWKAMQSLDTISTATMEQLGDLTQLTAIETGRQNMTNRGGETLAAVAPFESNLIWERYPFDDFLTPVVEGQLPAASDDEVTNRGPYDVIFGWREPQRGPRPPGSGTGGSTEQTTRPDSPWSIGTGGNIFIGRPLGPVIAYNTYGPWEWLNRVLSARWRFSEIFAGQGGFDFRVRAMGENKLAYLWPNADLIRRQIVDPDWVTDYDEADDVDAGDVRFTQFVRQTFINSFSFQPYDGALQRLIGQSGPVTDQSEVREQIIQPRGKHMEVPGLDKTCDHIWDDGSGLFFSGTDRRTIAITNARDRRRAGRSACCRADRSAGVLLPEWRGQ